MKRRMLDKEIWNKKAWIKMEGWAKLLHLYMFQDLADFAGIAELHRDLAELKMKCELPAENDEIVNEISPFWTHLEGGYFIAKGFINQTQGGKDGIPLLRFDNFAHKQIFTDMIERHNDGVKGVFQAFLQANPTMRIQSIQETEQLVIRREAEIMNSRDNDGVKQARLNGLKSPKECLTAMKEYVRILGVASTDLIEVDVH